MPPYAPTACRLIELSKQTELMHFLILCRVIDNLGDAGFCTRLALELHKRGHLVDLICDQPSVILRLATFQGLRGLSVLSMEDYRGRIASQSIQKVMPTATLEPFGTSSEQTSTRTLNDEMKEAYPDQPWLIIDYLSAENWTKSFHLTQSICPKSGHVSTYFYPGFEEGTGGVIHSDLPTFKGLQAEEDQSNDQFKEIFVFSYPSAPLHELDACLTEGQHLTIAGDDATPTSPKGRKANFCSLPDFDDLLQNFDFLFVRGEDSFVRAQLAGKPFVWNIYATEDGAHKDKLLTFFRLYRQGLSDEAAGALLSLWWAWNDLGEINTHEIVRFNGCQDNLALAWGAVQQVAPELRLHALNWKHKLLTGPELVSEILTWTSKQSLRTLNNSI